MVVNVVAAAVRGGGSGDGGVNDNDVGDSFDNEDEYSSHISNLQIFFRGSCKPRSRGRVSRFFFFFWSG